MTNREAVMEQMPATAQTILQRCVCLTLRCTFLGNNRRVPLTKLEHMLKGDDESDEDGTLSEEQFHATMRLVDPRELRDAKRVPSQAKSFLRSIAIPAPVFGQQTYLLPLAAARSVVDRLEAFRSQLRAEALLLSERYAKARDAQREKLGTAFDASLYASKEDVAAAFSISWDFISFKAPELIETVDRALFEDIRAQKERQLDAAFAEVKVALRETLRDVVAEIARKLTPGDDGRPKVIRGTVLRDLADYLSTFSLRNVVDDADLARTVEQLQRLTDGVDRDLLADDDGLREAMRASLTETLADLDALVATAPRRAVSIGGPLEA